MRLFLQKKKNLSGIFILSSKQNLYLSNHDRYFLGLQMGKKTKCDTATLKVVEIRRGSL